MNLNNHGRKSNGNSRRDREIAVDISLRRRKVAELLQTTGMSSPEIAQRLGVDDSTIRYDIIALKNEAVDYLYDLCKQDLCFFYRQTILDLDHARHECWTMYNNTNDKKITPKDRLQALRTIGQLDLARFELLSRGEVIMSIKALNERVNALKPAAEQEQAASDHFSMNNRDLDKLIDVTHKNLIDVEASIPSSNNTINTNHPSRWTDQQYSDYARKWIYEFAHMISWRDNDKAMPRLTDYPELYAKLAGFPESFLKDCLRYRTTLEQVDGWLKLTPTERYQQKKKEWASRECSVWHKYGNWYNAPPDKTGCAASSENERGVCVPECEYYEPTGSISDEEVLSWYTKEIGDLTYEQLKHDNTLFLQDFITLLKKQASELPANVHGSEDYYPRLEDLSL